MSGSVCGRGERGCAGLMPVITWAGHPKYSHTQTHTVAIHIHTHHSQTQSHMYKHFIKSHTISRDKYTKHQKIVFVLLIISRKLTNKKIIKIINSNLPFYR